MTSVRVQSVEQYLLFIYEKNVIFSKKPRKKESGVSLTNAII